MATLLAHVRIKEGFEAEFEAIGREMYRATHDSEHVLRYEYWRAREPGCWYVLESFDGYEGFLAHQASGHHEAAAPRLREIMASIDLEWIDPVEGAAPLPPTTAGGELDGDLAPLAERFPLQIAPWWSTT